MILAPRGKLRPHALLLAALSSMITATASASFVNFESGQVRPLALSSDGSRLYAVNTPDNRLEVFDVTADGLAHAFDVPVGLEPVSVALRNDEEAWVVNHLSDSISVVRVGGRPHVAATLHVGDEPRDIVFAGPGRDRAFITCAARGQNRPVDPALTTPGTGRADVWVFDAVWRDQSAGGTPLSILTLFGDTPRALAATPDGSAVYAAVFLSGNQTTTIAEDLVCDGGAEAAGCVVGSTSVPGGLPAPNANFESAAGPETGLIVRYDPATGHWTDELGRLWDGAVRFSLPDLDVFRIDAATLAVTGTHAHVGTTLFAMAVNPAGGNVYVANTEAHNHVRFEGAASGRSSVRGRLHQARITILSGEQVLTRALNKHLDYEAARTSRAAKRASVATPAAVAVSGDGADLYVAAHGSSRIAVYDTVELEADTFVPSRDRQVHVRGGGPTGLALDDARERLYVLTRFDNGISIIDTAQFEETFHVRMPTPEPDELRRGRRMLYDARAGSGNGEASCSSCHVFGDLDQLAWDLGNPDAPVVPNFNELHFGDYQDFHPMKGPMVTQSLRGMAGHGPMHWRGDRTGATTPQGDPQDERAGFLEFHGAFQSLLGRERPLPFARMERFADFALTIAYPPNPLRSLDGSLTQAQQRGRDLYFGRRSDKGGFNCNGCHVLSHTKQLFGTDGSIAEQDGPQLFKIPHLRNLYQKVGMFGRASSPRFPEHDDAWMGEQIRGFGFLHDGSAATIADLLGSTAFSLTAAEREDVEQFLLAYDTNLAPAVGQQVTIRSNNFEAAQPRLALLTARAAAGDCELVAKAMVGGRSHGWLRGAAGAFLPDAQAEPAATLQDLEMLARRSGHAVTFTCVPPGSGARIGIDRDGDGTLDGDEQEAG